jgi:hypothetical protein
LFDLGTDARKRLRDSKLERVALFVQPFTDTLFD